MLPFYVTKETKLREFQLKIIHRVYASCNLVSKFDVNTDGICRLCEAKYDICHFFFYCQKAVQFWRNLSNWFENMCNSDALLPLSVTDILFGILDKRNEEAFLANYCILHAKWYLHKTHKAATTEDSYAPIFIEYLAYMKKVIVVERRIAAKNHTIDAFIDTFDVIECYL